VTPPKNSGFEFNSNLKHDSCKSPSHRLSRFFEFIFYFELNSTYESWNAIFALTSGKCFAYGNFDRSTLPCDDATLHRKAHVTSFCFALSHTVSLMSTRDHCPLPL
jgi:hypothetical protein